MTLYSVIFLLLIIFFYNRVYVCEVYYLPSLLVLLITKKTVSISVVNEHENQWGIQMAEK
jgi:hypothetical protein